MKFLRILLILAALPFVSVAVFAAPKQDPLTRPIASKYAEQWLAPQQPFRIYGNTYFVGFGGMSMVLIRTDAGLILIDGALPQSVRTVEANIRQLGFRVKDIKYILNTEAHFDHAAGIAALARDSGAVTVTSPLGAKALRQGLIGQGDPQEGDIDAFPPVRRVREIGDGQTLSLGKVTVKAHFTPGHTPGSTSWSWRSCEKRQCRNFVFASSLTPVAAESYRFLNDARKGDLTPSFRQSIRSVGALPCDILVTAHPEHSGFDRKLRQRNAGVKTNPFVDPLACRAYAVKYERLLDERITKERSSQAASCTDRRDDDGDGVPNCLDRCPGNVRGQVIGPDGCVVPPADHSGPRIEFASGSAKLSEGTKRHIAQAAGILDRYGNIRVEIAGHTDSCGRAPANLALSRRRAQAVHEYLMTIGIRKNQIIAVKGYGDTRPLMNPTAGGDCNVSVNNRVELNVRN